MAKQKASGNKASCGTQRRGRLLTSTEREAVLALLFEGWGKGRACHKLGFSHHSLLRTAEEVPEFAAQVMQACEHRNEAVEMALFKAALEGKVTAQKFWLERQDQQQPAGKNAHVLSEEDDLSTLSDEELIERARAVGIDLPPQIAQRLAKAYRRGRSGDVPPAAGD